INTSLAAIPDMFTSSVIFTVVIAVLINCRASVPDESLVNHVFLSNDPFDDDFTKAIVHMDRTQLKNIRIMNEQEFMIYLNSDNKTINSLVRMGNPTATIFDNNKIDDQLIGQSEIDQQWEDLVVSGPLVINYIGNLMVIASKRDFPFKPQNVNHVYKYIRYPQSFRTTFIQLANDMYNAFLVAHTSMDRIQLNMEQVPRHIKTTLKLLTTAPPTLISSLLPLSISSIEHIATNCALLANSTVAKFTYLKDVLQEIIEVSHVTIGTNENILHELEVLYDQSVQQQQLTNNAIQGIKQKYEEAKQILQQAQNDYSQAYHAIPTTRGLFSSIGKIVKRAFSVITAPFKILGCLFGLCVVDNTTADNTAVDNTAVDNTAENARKTAQLALDRLKEAEKHYDNYYTQLLAEQNKVVSIINSMTRLDLSKVDTEELISILYDAARQIILIISEWDKLLRFFTKLSTQADQTQNVILNEFVKQIQSVQEQNLLVDDAMREFFVQLLIEPADLIDRESHLLYLMSKTYYDVSNDYMMDKLASLSTLLLIQHDNERQRLLEQIANDTTTTSAKVSRLAFGRRQEYQQRNKARQQEYSHFIEQQLQ
ncbi:unnamed protein product, partial [Didymodactylos carnosus]